MLSLLCGSVYYTAYYYAPFSDWHLITPLSSAFISSPFLDWTVPGSRWPLPSPYRQSLPLS